MSHTFETIRLDPSARGVTRLTLARPAKHNALNATMIREITAAANLIAADPAVRVVVLAAEGRSFCAGGDLDWMKQQADRDRAGKLQEAGALALMLERLDRLPKLVIGDVRGAAYAGGLGMVALCDVVFACESSVFALTEVKLGLIPATIGPFVLRRIGGPNARRIMLNARPFGAREAQRIGLVSEVLPVSDIDAAIEREIGFALACAPGAVAATKAMIRRLAAGENIGAEATAALLADRWESEEAKAGISAFFSRGRPPWSVE